MKDERETKKQLINELVDGGGVRAAEGQARREIKRRDKDGEEDEKDVPFHRNY